MLLLIYLYCYYCFFFYLFPLFLSFISLCTPTEIELKCALEIKLNYTFKCVTSHESYEIKYSGRIQRPF